jgi:hypothetical protein
LRMKRVWWNCCIERGREGKRKRWGGANTWRGGLVVGNLRPEWHWR